MKNKISFEKPSPTNEEDRKDVILLLSSKNGQKENALAWPPKIDRLNKKTR